MGSRGELRFRLLGWLGEYPFGDNYDRVRLRTDVMVSYLI